MSVEPADATLLTAVPDSDEGSLSMLGNLKARREQVIKGNWTELPVPRWDSPQILVRYTAIPHTVFKSANLQVDRAADKKKAEIEVNVNSDILARACLAVYGVVNGERFSLRPGDYRGDPTKFDEDLAENLGSGKSAREVIKALYITDGDILSTAGKIAEFSGYKEQEADESIAGE